MNIQHLQIGWGDRLLMAIISVLLLVAGLFASLLVLAVVGAMALVSSARLWRLKRLHSKDIIDVEYQVCPK